jgi:quinol monooxygenase YgiN
MATLELSAHMTIRPGQLEGFKKQAAEIIRLTKERDTQTLRYDWFLSADGTQCEVHEAYKSEQGLFEHNQHIMEARATLFRDYAYDHEMTAYGPISQQLVELANTHAGGIGLYAFIGGLESEPMV